jgi:cytidylate kinase
MKKSITIAIDGPAASGKSTLAQALANELGLLYFDTGVMYRAVTLAALRRGISIFNEHQITTLAQTVQIDVTSPTKEDGRQYNVLLDSEDVTWEIRQPDVNSNVSEVSAFAGVRTALTEQQRRIAQRGGVVMSGRDIGTVVLPDADIKLFLTASVEERANRRFAESVERGEPAEYNQVLGEIQHRDHIDSSRSIAPLRPAKDAITIDSDNMNIKEVLEFALKIIKKRKD